MGPQGPQVVRIHRHERKVEGRRSINQIGASRASENILNSLLVPSLGLPGYPASSSYCQVRD